MSWPLAIIGCFLLTGFLIWLFAYDNDDFLP